MRTIYMTVWLWVAAAAGCVQAAETLAIVAAKGSTLENLSGADLLKLFRGERSKAPDGSKVVVVMRDTGSAERDAALALIFRMTEAEYNRHFLQATFTGAVQSAPKVLSSPAAVKRFVSGTAGGIGYVKAGDVDESVKVIKVDGKSPTDPGYPLRTGN